MKRIITTSALASVASAAVLIGTMGGVANAATTNSGGASMQPSAAKTAQTSRTTTTTTTTTTKPTQTTQVAGPTCRPISFTVLHNDRTGGVVLPAGQYRVWSPNMSCKTASNDLTNFLDNYQGRIPGWNGKQLGTGYAVFTNQRTGQSFAAQLLKPSSR